MYSILVTKAKALCCNLSIGSA